MEIRNNICIKCLTHLFWWNKKQYFKLSSAESANDISSNSRISWVEIVMPLNLYVCILPMSTFMARWLNFAVTCSWLMFWADAWQKIRHHMLHVATKLQICLRISLSPIYACNAPVSRICNMQQCCKRTSKIHILGWSGFPLSYSACTLFPCDDPFFFFFFIFISHIQWKISFNQ